MVISCPSFHALAFLQCLLLDVYLAFYLYHFYAVTMISLFGSLPCFLNGFILVDSTLFLNTCGKVLTTSWFPKSIIRYIGPDIPYYQFDGELEFAVIVMLSTDGPYIYLHSHICYSALSACFQFEERALPITSYLY
ncbi:hypothetical protein L218DRAFT_277506 [Marasmius fiardii PR-910]|nr:hypothetical protein L218DRAFT_277506 [Marasmius fiardii PR-910]